MVCYLSQFQSWGKEINYAEIQVFFNLNTSLSSSPSKHKQYMEVHYISILLLSTHGNLHSFINMVIGTLFTFLLYISTVLSLTDVPHILTLQYYALFLSHIWASILPALYSSEPAVQHYSGPPLPHPKNKQNGMLINYYFPKGPIWWK